MSKWFSLRNLGAVIAAPFTAGLSLAAMNNGDGDSIIGDLTGANSAKKANERNIQLQKETNAQSIELANTAHQREVADLRKAGLNPVLSAGGSGAATPQLGTATVENTQPGGLLAQAQTAAGVLGTVSAAQQAGTQAKLNAVNAELQPSIAKAQIAEGYANAGNAKAQADYTTVMKDIDKAQKQANTELTKAETWDKSNENAYHKHTGTTKDMPTAHKLFNSVLGSLTNPKATQARPY